MLNKKFNYSSKKKQWDPINGFNELIIEINYLKLKEKYENYNKNPSKPRLILIILFLLIINFIILSITFFSWSVIISSSFLLFSFIALTIFFKYYFFYKLFTRDIIKYEITNKNNFYFDPFFSEENTTKLKENIPEIFNQKDFYNQKIEDQIWGKIRYERINYYFYSGLFNYSVGTGNDKINVINHFFIIKNNKRLDSEFLIYPKNLFNKFFISSKNILTNSIEFNKIFAFNYNGKKIEKENDIVKYINPKVQIKLLEIKQKKESFTVFFKKDYTIFLFNGLLIKKTKTNFFISSKIYQEDIDIINNELKFLIENTKEIVHHLK
jgi:hypothetical protein